MEHRFPSISPFLELIEQERRSPNKIILRDHTSGVTVTAGQLLYSVSLLRNKLDKALLHNGYYESEHNGEKFIFLIAPPGVQYLVSMLTIFSLAAGMSAQSIVVRPEEVKAHFKVARPIGLLYAPAFAQKAEAIKKLCAESDSGIDPNLPYVEIETSFPGSFESHTYVLEEPFETDLLRLGTLFFTSGTSGAQKGVVHSYEALLASARERIETWKLTENDVLLNQKPGNWMGGIFGIIPSLMAGSCLETCIDVFNPKWFWERISKGDVSIFDIAPTGYDRLAQYFDEHIAVLPHAQKEKYIRGMIATRCAGVTGSLIQPRIQERWTKLRRGKPLLNFLGSTEVTLICNMKWENPDYPDMCSVGPAVPGVEVKLVEGEMRLKAPTMFSHYISDDPAQTRKAFDEEGFFKTGDCAEKVGDCYVIHGRANIDVLHFWGFTVHTGEVENALSSLPYIANAVAFPIEDEKCQERTAAVLEIKPGFQARQPDLQRIRADLKEKTGLFLFKYPTVIYWLREGEDIPETSNGKISKKEARKKFFGDRWQHNENLEILDLKGMEYWRMGGLS
ncbi:hypothetical protein HYALB_00009094 [Hymenoscyphus albidus]|uniref:AMP-dependent synthetase/ligase domain-containing protein n=1 Tax=Hymenoscyphus albidus TaxID=595503 RepID=A0A9N9Q250_9HELO|nr:hypothetical protein HYALB_00009094 [Hymenoscyphus albidus]